MNRIKQRVVVALSGGVDSSVSAALLKQQGYEVIGMMLRLWSEPGKANSNKCCTPDSMAIARRVCAQLGIPFYAIDAQQVFRDTVVQSFINGYLNGITPNPCVTCNRHIRWDYLLNRALSFGADYLATGHYARIHKDDKHTAQLLRSVDSTKDQSYVLHVLNQEQLLRTLFPIGEYTKLQVRDIARKFDLPVAERTDSQDLCFLAGDDYRNFLKRTSSQINVAGPIITRQGETIGQHTGLAFYTIGQRKGLGISASQPHYVIEKNISQNALIVGTADELGKQKLVAANFNWIRGTVPDSPFRALVKIRYRARAVPALVSPNGNNMVHILFDDLVRDITPGQAAVVYAGDICLGGGIIQSG
jgi:tRNA-specific 2-thiouridylase